MQLNEMKAIVESVPLFKGLEQKENLLVVISALGLRLVSLSKASEIMNMTKVGLLELLGALNIEFSYLSTEDIELERDWPQ